MLKLRLTVALVVAGLLSGCSSIGMVNGIHYGDRSVAKHNSEERRHSDVIEGIKSYCGAVPELCILYGIVVAGGAIVLVNASRDMDH